MASRVKPGPIKIPNCVQVKINWVAAQQNFSNVLHGNIGTGTIPNGIADTLFTAFKTALTSSGWAADMAAGSQLQSVWVKDLRDYNLPFQKSTGLPESGTGATTALPLSTAIAVTLNTAQSGRAFRGRVYLGALDNIVAQDARHHDTTSGTNAKAFIDAVNAAMTSNAMPLAIAQRELVAGTDSHGNALPPRAAAVVPVTQVVITSTRFDTQRSRLGR